MPKKKRKFFKRVVRKYNIGGYEIIIKDLEINTKIFRDVDRDIEKLAKRFKEFCKEKFNVEEW